MSQPPDFDRIIDYFVDHNDLPTTLLLLKTIAYPEQGGSGYKLRFYDSWTDYQGYDVDHDTKTIWLYTKGFWLALPNQVQDYAAALGTALEVSIAHTRASLAARIGWGTGKVLLGVVEVGTGLVGILIPEPGTTVAGVVVFSLGANNVIDGFSQLAGANRGNGYNVLGEASGALGSGVAGIVGGDPEVGRRIGEGVFLVSSVALGSWGSIRILRVPGQAFLRMGVDGRPGGAVLGRIDMLYPSSRAGDGLTVLSIRNNANQSILRFVTHSGQLMVNGRIVGASRVLSHATDARTILKGLLKLLAHGARQGW